jgi:hypothetical protein
MKRFGFTLLWAMLLSVAPMLAQGQYDNTLYIENMEAFVDSEVTLSVRMKNSVDAEAFAFDLILPYGMEVATDTVGNPVVSLSEERTTADRTDTFMSAMLDTYQGSAVRVIAASSICSAIPAGDGEVCTVRVRIPADMAEGEYEVQLRKISIADTLAHSHDVEQMTTTITVREYLVGDANVDGEVTVDDLVAIAYYVLGYTPVRFSFKAADANRDGLVDVADFITVVHILGEDPTQSQGGFPRMPPIRISWNGIP